MSEILTHTVQWWHWIALGVILGVAETMTGTFVLLILGGSAIPVGIVALLYPLSFAAQLLMWIVLSLVSTAIWLRWFRTQPTEHSGQADFGTDTVGTLLQDVDTQHRGKVRFDAPVLGNTTWHARAETPLRKGTRVKIVKINGQLLTVAPVATETSPVSSPND